MNKTELKNFAISSRLELLARVRDRATFYGITEEKCKNNQIVSSNSFQKLDGQLLSKNEIDQRNALLQRIQINGYVQVIEESAYTWFNRFIALKYMEAHNLLPIDMRVIPQSAGELPQLVREAQNVDIKSIELDAVVQYLDANQTEELYKYLIIALCNQLNESLPQMFEKISDFTELLFPDGLMKAESFLGLLADVDEDNWKDIQVIGWLYQYYISEKHEEIVDVIKATTIKKEDIPAATCLYTTDWVVKYMVENSLGRAWIEGHPDKNLLAKWQYFLEEPEQTNETNHKLEAAKKKKNISSPDQLKVLDPCMGSGHILAYAFDVLMDIYRSVGYTDRDAVECIVSNNLYGLDIDDRAVQLAYFSIMMKGCEYDKRFLRRGIQPMLCAIQESNSLKVFDKLRGQVSFDKLSINTANELVEEYINAKEYGSIISPKIANINSIDTFIEQLEAAATNDLELSSWYESARHLIPQLAKQTLILQQKYDAVITNPPYMNRFSTDLKNYLQSHYANCKSDLFSVFIYRNFGFCKEGAYSAFMTPNVWMFLKSHEKLREYIISKKRILSLIQIAKGAFYKDATVDVCCFVLSNIDLPEAYGHYLRLEDFKGDMDVQNEKVIEAQSNPKCKYRYFTKQNDFFSIPGIPISYWVSKTILNAFSIGIPLGNLADSKQGMATADNNKFLRIWHELPYSRIKFDSVDILDAVKSGYKWFPYNKGGEFRKWYGNNEYVVNWENDGYEIKHFFDDNGKLRSRPQNLNYMCKSSVSWSDVTSGINAFRFKPNGHFFDITGMSFFSEELAKYLLALCNTKIVVEMLKIIAPTLHCQCGDVALIPVIICNERKEIIDKITNDCINLVKEDWDSFETSWDFQVHPLIVVRKEIAFGQFAEARLRDANKIERCFAEWETQCKVRFDNLKKNEEELNAIFIDIYGIGEELTPEVAEKYVTIRKADLGRDIRSLISYAVGCMFGRYSLDTPGLAFTGDDWDPSKYFTYPVDRDGILPITDDEYFQDDVVSMFVRWVKTVYGEETLEENLQFIANALNPNGGTSREVIRSYFLNDFYSDHLKIYQKRPIYWQFDSGKQNGFKALMYLHRYDQDTVARLRTDYVHELQDRYRTQLEDARKTAESGDARQRSAANKRAQKLDKQLTELNKYEELVHHYADMRIPLDLDDGVKVNYAKLQDILTKIK